MNVNIWLGFFNEPYLWMSRGLWEAALDHLAAFAQHLSSLSHGAVQSTLCISLSFHVFGIVYFLIENKVRFLSEWMASESDSRYVL